LARTALGRADSTPPAGPQAALGPCWTHGPYPAASAPEPLSCSLLGSQRARQGTRHTCCFQTRRHIRAGSPRSGLRGVERSSTSANLRPILSPSSVSTHSHGPTVRPGRPSSSRSPRDSSSRVAPASRGHFITPPKGGSLKSARKRRDKRCPRHRADLDFIPCPPTAHETLRRSDCAVLEDEEGALRTPRQGSGQMSARKPCRHLAALRTIRPPTTLKKRDSTTEDGRSTKRSGGVREHVGPIGPPWPPPTRPFRPGAMAAQKRPARGSQAPRSKEGSNARAFGATAEQLNRSCRALSLSIPVSWSTRLPD
jgi:hypothetical protein